jgi:FkbM family methyltransferase
MGAPSTLLTFDDAPAAPKPSLQGIASALQPALAVAADHQWLATFLGLEKPVVAADIGAADYGEVNAFDDLCKHGFARKFGFEPEEKFFAELSKRNDARQTYLPYALGDGETHTLHICPAGMTSLLEPDPAALNFFNGFEPWGVVERKVPMPTKKLADVAEIDPLHFIKIDVQGSELMILQHGGAKLADLAMVQIEVSFVALYKNQATFGEIDMFFRSQGFIPHHMYAAKRWIISPTMLGNDFRRPLNQLLEADIVYIRDLVHPDGIDDDTLRRTAYLAEVVYDSVDLAVRCILELVKRGKLPEGAHLAYVQGFGERKTARQQRLNLPR